MVSNFRRKGVNLVTSINFVNFWFVTGITSMEDGKRGLAELLEIRIFTWEPSVCTQKNSNNTHIYVCSND